MPGNIRLMLLLLITAILTLMVTSSPIDPERWLINRPTKDMMFRRIRASQVKGRQDYGVKGGHHHPIEVKLQKGEYKCGNRICRLKPGEVPSNCDGVCQYQLRHDSDKTMFERRQ